jgi:hypothetical protein
MTTSFDRVAPILSVSDVSAALAHYRKLGFTGDAYGGDVGSDGPIYGFLSRGPVQLHLARVPALDPKASTSACYLYVADANALYEEWRSADVEGRLVAPIDTPYRLREFTYVDPYGNLLRVGSALP